MEIPNLKIYSKKLITAPCNIYYGGDIDDFLNIEIAPTQNILCFFGWEHSGIQFHISAEKNNLLERLAEKVSLHKNHNFWIYHSWINFDSYINGKFSNLKSVKYIDELYLHGERNVYININPQIEKNFDSKKHWFSISNNRRVHRYIAAMYLLGTEVTAKGTLRFDPTEILEHPLWEGYLEYWKYNNCNEIFSIESSFPILKKGFYKILHNVEYETRVYTQTSIPSINSYNFDQFLRTLYKETFVEVVNETTFIEPFGIITEKFINSVYGCNFPIILNVHGTVAHLRELGFDMFDDVVDHSYDTETDPMKRLVQALSSNLQLLNDPELAKNSWKKCKSRMISNVELAKELERNVPNVITNTLISLNNEICNH